MYQLNLFDNQRITSAEAIELTMQSLQTYGKDYDHWVISFSGGKDSSTLVTLTIDLIESGRVPRPESLHVLYADTRMELPPLQMSAMQILSECKRRGFSTEVVMAPIERRFLPYILGRGVPPPNNSTLRYCTQNIKLNPMKLAMERLHLRVNPGLACELDARNLRMAMGILPQNYINAISSKSLSTKAILTSAVDKAEIKRLYQRFSKVKLLSLNGVRIGESAIRDRRILTSCSKNGSECGQGWFQRDLPDSICDKLSPILHWRVCQIWDWLRFDAPGLGFDTEILVDAYGGDEAEEINARTGCICCPLASKDLALDALIQMPHWSYLAPLKELRHWYLWARRFDNRLQKHGEINKDGKLSKNPCRKGPLTIKARQEMLAAVLAIQDKVNTAAIKRGRPLVNILNQEEINYIHRCHDNQVFPQGWTGDEPIGSELLPQIYSDGTVQPTLF
ncbi:MAG: phosphoadenosine phosphosulfate reductase [Symploca sp. SIO2D2]|nr:phosphoadenosine phosphosulfate reductase [Symploca sp. SIO2D2]